MYGYGCLNEDNYVSRLLVKLNLYCLNVILRIAQKRINRTRPSAQIQRKRLLSKLFINTRNMGAPWLLVRIHKCDQTN